MKTFRYWSKASERVETPDGPWNLCCWGGSDNSVEDALRRAEERVRSASQAVSDGRSPERYSYSDRPLREEVIAEMTHEDKTNALLTRNAYGTVVLNTANVMFADIDYANDQKDVTRNEWSAGFFSQLIGFAGGLFGKKVPQQAFDTADKKSEVITSEDERIIDSVRSVTERHSGLGLRLYRTHNGFRCLVTSQTWDPLDSTTTSLLEELGSDPLYIRLCRGQQCFRARLSPKPWRCGIMTTPPRFPWADDEMEQRYRKWVETYEQETANYSTCTFIGVFGDSHVDPAVDAILRVHDELACAGEGPIA